MINDSVKIKYNKWKFIKDEHEKDLKSISNVNLNTKNYDFNNNGYQKGVDYYYDDHNSVLECMGEIAYVDLSRQEKQFYV